MAIPDSVIPSHPLADLFPMLSLDDADALRVDIAANGLRERIVILDGQILDGRNRYRAAVGAGVIFGDLPDDASDLWVSHFRRFNPAQDGDPLAWVLSKNLHRRHLSESQRAMVAAKIEGYRHGGARQDFAEQDANLPLDRKGAAEALHVSERSVSSAARVRDHGAPELVERVESGEVAVSAAAELARLPVGEQLALLQTRDPKAFRRALRDLRASRPNDNRVVMNTRVQPPDDLDYSPTPPWATRSLLQLVLPHLGQSLTGLTVLEPACGEGHISGVLEEAGPLAVWASDIWDYSVDGVSPPGWVGCRDYLADSEPIDGIDWVVMNSPFGSKAERFAHKALGEAQVGVAMFVRLGWLASNGRYERLYSINPPTLIAIFAEDVPLHMGRWEPDGQTLSDYIWIVWVKGMAPQPPFWIPPGQRSALSLPDDIERFTAHPVRSRPERSAEVHAVSERIAMSFEEAASILKDRYATTSGEELQRITGRPIGTIRTWAHRLQLTSAARLKGNAGHLGDKLKKAKETVS